MLKNLIHTLAEVIGSKNENEQPEVRRPLKHTAVTMKVLGSEKEVKVGWLLSRIIDGLIEIPAPQVKPSYEELKDEDFDADSYVRRSQVALEKSVLDAEQNIDGSIIPYIVSEDHAAGTMAVPYVKASSFRAGLHTHCISAFGAPLNDDAMNSVAKTCAYLSTPIFAEQSFRKTVMVIPNEWLLHKAMMDGVGYIRAKGETLIEHPRCGAITDFDVLQVRGLVTVPIHDDNILYLYKGTIAPIHITQMAGVFKREYLEKVDEALSLGYIIATTDTLKKAPIGVFPDAQFYLHDSSSMSEQWTSLKSISLQSSMKLCWHDISGLDEKLFRQALEYCAALSNDRAIVEDVAGKLDLLDGDSDLPIEELSSALDQIRFASLAPYDRINLSALLVKIMTTKRIKQVAEVKEKGMRLYVVANNDVPRGCVRVGLSNYWRMKAEWKSELAVVARPPYTTTSVNVCRVICSDSDDSTATLNPADLNMFGADLDGDRLVITKDFNSDFVSLGQIIDDMPFPASITKDKLSRYCPMIPAQYGTNNETAAILFALATGMRVDVGDSLVLGLITKLEERGMSPLDARICGNFIERNLFEALIDCRKHVSKDTRIPNLAALSQIQFRERFFAPNIYKLLSGKLDFDGVSVADIPKAIREELEDSPITKNPILETVRDYLLDFLPERCAYTFNRVNCDKAKALIREILYEYPDIVKELQFSVRDNGKSMTIENPVLDTFLSLCKEKRFDEATKYMDEIISPWIAVYTIDKSDRAAAVWFILSAFVVKNRAAAGHMRWGFILRHIPAIILRTVVEMTYDQTELIDHELYTEYRKKDIPMLTILKTA